MAPSAQLIPFPAPEVLRRAHAENTLLRLALSCVSIALSRRSEFGDAECLKMIEAAAQHAERALK